VTSSGYRNTSTHEKMKGQEMYSLPRAGNLNPQPDFENSLIQNCSSVLYRFNKLPFICPSIIQFYVLRWKIVEHKTYMDGRIDQRKDRQTGKYINR